MIHILNDKYNLISDCIGSFPENVELDLGCGSGGFTVALAKSRPGSMILGADVMLGRLRKVEKLGKRNGVNNLELLRVEARHLLTIVLPDDFLARLHILCPDPWPKHKHKSHRLMSSDFMAQIHRVLRKDGVLHFATDDPRYMESTLRNIESSGLFEALPPSALDDVRDFKTDFEKDWLAVGRTVPHVAFRRKDA